MPSQYITTLRKQAALIEKTYINFSYDPSGNYSKTDLMNAGAYILLVHAEIETYIEERIQELVRLADSKWKSKGKVSRTLLASCVFRGEEANPPTKHSTKDNFSKLVIQSINDAASKIAGNHGIREHNFIKLLYVVGFEVHSVDPLLVAELDAIGAIRGDHAHISSRHHFKRKFDPYDMTKKIANALTLLDIFDKNFSAFRKAQFGR